MKGRTRLNPYDPAQPAKDFFVGREDLLKELAHGLKDGKSYELTGPVKVGKTNLLREIQRRINEDSQRRNLSAIPIPVYVECSRRTESVEALFAEITTAVAQRLIEHDCPLEYQTQRSAVAAAESGTPGSLTKALDVVFGKAYDKSKQTFRAILILDALHRITDQNVLKNLLGALNNDADRKHINVLLTGRHHLHSCVPDSVSDLSMLLSGQRDLAPLNERETKALIAVAGRLGWPVAGGIEKLAFQLTFGNPYRLQYYLRASLEQYREITPKSLLGVYQPATEKYLNELLSETSDRRDQKVTKRKRGPSKRKLAFSDGGSETGGLVETSTSPTSSELLDFVASVGPFFMSEHVVAGKYVRYDIKDVQHLKSEAVRIMDACSFPSRDGENFFVWGRPGEGKTFFVSEVAKHLGVRYVEINLNDSKVVPDGKTLTSLLSAAVEGDEGVLCALDEIDKRLEASEWLYPSIFTFLDSNKGKRSAESPNKVFVLIGSKQPDFEAFKETIRNRAAGMDLLRRVVHPEIMIPQLNLGDRMVTALSMIWTARPQDKKIAAVNSLALAYLLAMNPTNGAVADATAKALSRVKDHETSFTANHLPVKLEAWEEFYENYPSAKSSFLKAFIRMHS